MDESAPNSSRNSAVSLLLSLVVCGIALSVLTGWIFQLNYLKTILPNATPMNPVTALCFLLAGLSFVSLRFLNNPVCKLLIQGVAFIIGSVGFVMLLKYIVGVDVRIDRIFFESQLGINRMAPHTSFNFLLLGIVLFILTIKKNLISLAHLLTAIFGLIGIYALFAYVYNYVGTYGQTVFNPMAIHTAFSFVLLAINVLLVNPDKGILGAISTHGKVSHLFQNMRMRFKLLFGFGILIALLLLLSWITYIQLLAIQNSHIPLRSNIQAMRKAELEMRRYEKDFLMQDALAHQGTTFFQDGKSPNLEKWEANFQDFNINLSALIENHTHGSVDDLQKLKQDIAEYHYLFLRVVDNYRNRGSKDTGFEGKMRTAIRDVEVELGGDPDITLGNTGLNPTLAVYLLQARRGEKDFFVRKDIKETERVFNAIAELKKRTASNRKVTSLLDEYLLRFNQIVELDREIGLSAEEGLLGQMNQQVNEAEPVLENEEKDILAVTNRSITFIIQLLVTLSVLFALIGFGLAQMLSKLITQSITLLQQGAKSIAQGDLANKIEIYSKDELGQLADSFNEMSLKIQESKSQIEQNNKELAAKIEELERFNKVVVNRELRMIELKQELANLKEGKKG